LALYQAERGKDSVTALNIQGLGKVAGISNINIPSGGSVLYRTVGDPSAGLLTGWAEVQSPVTLNGAALFRRHASDGKYYEGSIPLAAASTNFTIPFDGSTFATGDLTYTGMAIANPDPSAIARILCNVFDLLGRPLGTNLQVEPLPGYGHKQLLLQFTQPFQAASNPNCSRK
jgi:hypothetical protein